MKLIYRVGTTSCFNTELNTAMRLENRSNFSVGQSLFYYFRLSPGLPVNVSMLQTLCCIKL